MDGQTQAGLLSADSPAQVRHKVREQGLFVVSVDTVSDAGPSGYRKSWRSRISRRDLLTLTSQLAIMARAGVSLASSLQTLSEQCPNPALKESLERVHERISAGDSVSSAFRNQEHVFGKTYVASMAAGDASGQVPMVLDRLVQLLRSESRFRSTLNSLLAYPIVLMVTSSLVMFALMFFVLPQFAEVFAQLEVPLPMTTRFLLAVSGELLGRAWLWAGLLVAGVLGFFCLLSSAGGRRWWDQSAVSSEQ